MKNKKALTLLLAPVLVLGVLPAPTAGAADGDLYEIIVTGGRADSAFACEGDVVMVTADEPEAGTRFREWTGVEGLTFINGTSAFDAEAFFLMPDRAVELEATYEEASYATVTVEFGEGHGEFAAARFGGFWGFTVSGTTLTYDVEEGVTIGDAKEIFTDLADFSPSAIDNGELFTDILALNPASHYASLEELNAENAQWDGETVPEEGITFYVQWEQPAGAVTVLVSAPEPGTEITVSGNEPTRRTDPQVSVSVTGNASLDTYSGANWWTGYDGTYYSGTVAAGQECYGRFYLRPNYGYYFAYNGETGPVVADGVSVTVLNDSEASVGFPGSYALVCAKVIAGHHTVTVTNGTASLVDAGEGESVTITADEPEAGMRFREWTGADGLTFTAGDAFSPEATFSMPASDVAVTATYEDIPAVSHTVTYRVVNGTWADGTAEDKTESVEDGGRPAGVPEGMIASSGFAGGAWDSDPAGAAITGDTTFTYTFEAEPPAAPAEYTVTGGAEGSWTKGSGVSFTITVKRSEDDAACFSHYTETLIDGTAVPVSAEAGSTVITISAETLEQLSTGTHTVTVKFDDGQVETKLTVKASSSPGDPTVPDTGDSSQMGLWTVLMCGSGAGLAALFVTGRKRKAGTGRRTGNGGT